MRQVFACSCHVPQKTAFVGNKESASRGRFQLRSVVSAVSRWPLSGGQSHPYYRRLSRVAAQLKPNILEVNFNPDPALYAKEDVGPKAGTWMDAVRHAQKSSAPRCLGPARDSCLVIRGDPGMLSCCVLMCAPGSFWSVAWLRGPPRWSTCQGCHLLNKPRGGSR